MGNLQLQSIGKAYGDLRVIDNLDMHVEEGSFTVFVGPSGCGKSTLLRMIAGLEPITSGDLKINGRRVNEATPVDRGVAMVFQNYALYPHMTVEQNLGFPLRMSGLGKAEIAKKVRETAASLQIEPLLRRRPAQLSGGQRQRVAIGRAIVRDPEIFLFDEPLSNLDAELRVSMRIEIARLHQHLKNTMIYVTHDQTEAMTLADRMVVMRGGKIEQAGTPEEIYDRPANTFVAGFIGSPRMNFLPARMGQTGQPVYDLNAKDGMLLGIRPEDIIAGGSDADLTLKVDVVENLGGTRYLYGSLEDGTTMIVEARESGRFKAGDLVPLHFRKDRMHLFDANGKRIEVGKAND